MNKLISIVVLFFGFGAHASFYQINCSNADASVQTATGHNQRFVKVTERDWVPGGGPVDTVLELSMRDTTYDYSDNQMLEEVSQTNCTESGQMGWSNWTQTSAKKIQIRKTDGTLFSEKILGVSEDRTSVDAYLICEDNGNSMIVCP